MLLRPVRCLQIRRAQPGQRLAPELLRWWRSPARPGLLRPLVRLLGYLQGRQVWPSPAQPGQRLVPVLLRWWMPVLWLAALRCLLVSCLQIRSVPAPVLVDSGV